MPEIRPKTARETEWEKQPRCLYDQLALDRCDSHTFPPDRDTCDKCLTAGLAQALDDRCTSRAMQLFISYKKLSKEEEQKSA